MKYTQAVGKSAMGSTRIYKLRESQLLDPTEPLELTCLDYTPHRIMEMVCGKFNEIMQRIADTL